MIAATAAFGTIAFTPASALIVTHTSMASPSTVHIQKGAINETVYLDELYLNDLGVFCVDVIHNITLGNQSPPLVYYKTAFMTDFGGNPLSVLVMKQITYLAHLGGKSNSRDVKQGVQAKIWQLESVTLSNFSNPAALAWANAYDPSLHVSKNVASVYASAGGYQAQIGAVTEPATWAMLIFGFGIVGVASRVRRQNTQVVLA
jgi:hypothetical protein